MYGGEGRGSSSDWAEPWNHDATLTPVKGEGKEESGESRLRLQLHLRKCLSGPMESP